MMKKFKPVLIGVAILASVVLGSYLNLKDRIIEPVRYRNIKVDSQVYQKPFKLKKKYMVNKNGDLEVYLGNKDEWYKVGKGLRVNEKNLSEILKEDIGKIKPYIREKIDELGWWYEDFKNGTRN